MNIFVLDNDPSLAARYHCDKHVVKMITETCQLLSTFLRSKGHTNSILYKSTHINHSCNVWLRESPANFMWLVSLLAGLLIQYRIRYNKFDTFIHAEEIHTYAYNIGCDYIFAGYNMKDHMTPFKLCMPEQYKVEGDPVTSYRNYYIAEKKDFCEWKNEIPEWWKE